MPAALWAAWKGAGIAWKIGTIVVPILLVLLLCKFIDWKAYHRGVNDTEQRYAQQALQQSARVVEQTAKQAELPVNIVQGLLKEQQEDALIKAEQTKRLAAYERRREQRKEEVHHEQPVPIICTNPDPLNYEFVLEWNTTNGLLTEQATDHHPVPSTDQNPTGTPDIRTEDASTAAVLRAHQADIEALKEASDYFRAMREFAKGNYIFQESWHQQREGQQGGNHP